MADFEAPGSCGDCVVCCEWLDIETEGLSKKAGILCHHSTGKGCGIHATRPGLCRGFFCGYRVITGLSDEWRPDRSGVMILVVTKDVPSQYTGAETGFNFVVLGGEAAILRPGFAAYVSLLVSRNVAVYLSADSPKTLINDFMAPLTRDPAGATAMLVHLYRLHLEAKKHGWVPKV